MISGRSYGDGCPVACSLDVVGDRWALLIVRELLLGPKRFNDLLAGLGGASPNVVSQRLRELTGHGVVHQRDLGPPARVRVYELTDWGRELEPAILDLGRWGRRVPAPDGARISLDSLLLALKVAADPAQVTGRYELRIGAETFAVDAPDGSVRIRRAIADRPDAILTAGAGTVREVLLGQRPLAEAVQSGDLRLGGDPQPVGQLVSLLLALAPDAGSPSPDPDRRARAGTAIS